MNQEKEQEIKIEEKNKKQISKTTVLLLILILVIILIDQISKLVVGNMVSEGNKVILPNVLEFTYVENRGGAFGVGQNDFVTFLITNIIVLGIIAKFAFSQNTVMETKVRVVLSFILAGGLSNVIDRIFRGFVFDFIDFSPMIHHFPVFNIADCFIILGWIFVVAFFAGYSWREIKKSSESKKQKKEKEKGK